MVLLGSELLLDFVAFSTNTSSEVIRVLFPLTIHFESELEAISVIQKGIFPVALFVLR